MGTDKDIVEGEPTPSSRTTRNCLHKQLRKTKYCMFHLQGLCQFGKDCSFAHSVSEMNGTPDLRKTQLCKVFAEGRCDDPNCHFAHGETELRSTDMFFKKSLCIWNEKGKCRNDSQCRFAHGLAELRSHQAGEQLMQEQLMQAAQQQEQSRQDAGISVEPPPQPKAVRKRNQTKKGKQNQHQMSALCMDLPHVQTRSSNSSLSGSSSDKSSQNSAAEPMKVKPQSVNFQESSAVAPDGLVIPMVAEALLRQQQMQHQMQESVAQRLGALEADLEMARFRQQMNAVSESNRAGPDIQAELESLRSGIGMLAAQCSQIQQRMHKTMEKIPPNYTTAASTLQNGSMLQNSSMGKQPYINSESMHLLLQMQMQDLLLQKTGLSRTTQHHGTPHTQVQRPFESMAGA